MTEQSKAQRLAYYIERMPLVYNDTHRPGGYFCHSVSAVQYPGRSNWCLVMVHRRSDT